MMKKTPRKKRKIRYSAVLLTIFACFMVYRCVGQIVEIGNLHNRQVELEDEYAALMEEQDSLQAQKDLLNDETYLERLARENLLMVRDGEYLIVPYEQNDEVVDIDKSSSAEETDIH